jgi:hypothetical protein
MPLMLWSCAVGEAPVEAQYASTVALGELDGNGCNRLVWADADRPADGDGDRGPALRSTFQALTKEAKTKFGLSPSFVVYDELGQSNTVSCSATAITPLLTTLSASTAHTQPI